MPFHQSDHSFTNSVCYVSIFHPSDDGKDLFFLISNNGKDLVKTFLSIRMILKQMSKVEDQICNLSFKQVKI